MDGQYYPRQPLVVESEEQVNQSGAGLVSQKIDEHISLHLAAKVVIISCSP
jgi:hypothetical protein